MRTTIEFLVVVVIAIFAPMGVCEVTFPMGGFGAAICGHNGWIQVFVYFLVGTAIVVARALSRRRTKRSPSEEQLQKR